MGNWKKCFVRGCYINDKDSPEEYLFYFPNHSFPKNSRPARFYKWLAFAQNPLLSRLETSPYYKAWICGKHFTENSFTNSLHNKLLKTAVPSLYPPERDISTLPDHVYSLPYYPGIIEKVYRPLSPDSECDSQASASSPQPASSPVPSPPPASPPPASPAPASPPPASPPADVELVLTPEEAKELIAELMDVKYKMTEENNNLKVEKIRLRMQVDSYKEDIAKWKSCAQTIVKKATQNSYEDFLQNRKEVDTLRSLLAKTCEEMAALRKEKCRLEKELNLFMLVPVEDDEMDPDNVDFEIKEINDCSYTG